MGTFLEKQKNLTLNETKREKLNEKNTARGPLDQIGHTFSDERVYRPHARYVH